jgi:hypothetical protein
MRKISLVNKFTWRCTLQSNRQVVHLRQIGWHVGDDGNFVENEEEQKWFNTSMQDATKMVQKYQRLREKLTRGSLITEERSSHTLNIIVRIRNYVLYHIPCH